MENREYIPPINPGEVSAEGRYEGKYDPASGKFWHQQRILGKDRWVLAVDEKKKRLEELLVRKQQESMEEAPEDNETPSWEEERGPEHIKNDWHFPSH